MENISSSSCILQLENLAVVSRDWEEVNLKLLAISFKFLHDREQSIVIYDPATADLNAIINSLGYAQIMAVTGLMVDFKPKATCVECQTITLSLTTDTIPLLLDFKDQIQVAQGPVED